MADNKNSNYSISYTGVGSRETPPDVLGQMIWLGETLAKRGYVLRSGGAGGADSAFEQGCNVANGPKEIYIPWRNFNDRGWNAEAGIVPDLKAAEPMLKETHPAFERLKPGAVKLHCRNFYQVLGDNLEKPSTFLICYTKGGALIGGTATAIRLAQKHGVPVYNLGDPKRPSFNKFLESIGLPALEKE